MGGTERPLLIAPSPDLRGFKNPPVIGGGAGKPPKQRLVERLDPRFAALREALDARRGSLQLDPSGPTIEQVLVFETNGPVKEFHEAAARTRGLEWLATEELRDLAPDEDFFVKKDPSKLLTAQLYLVLFNQEALEQLLSLWQLWRARRLPTEFRDWRFVFAQLRDIRRWSVQDRLRETRTLEYWRDRVAAGYETVTVEIELWFRSQERRTAAQGQVGNYVARMQGQVTATCVLEPIAYHAIVARLPIRAVEQILENPEVELLQCDDIRLVRPTGQAGAPVVEEAPEEEPSDLDLGATPDTEPVVALLDGLPLENHRRLTGRLVVDDPDGWAATYPVARRCHGTAMASLILHGDLAAGDAPADRKLYVRPILRPSSFDGRSETAPDDSSWLDLIHRAVRRILRGEGTEPPAAARVRVINLSIGDPYQPFIRTMSPLAKLLDWLAWTYQVLFVVSAGNHPESIRIATGGDESESLVAALAEDHRNRRILSPAEAINALTVGATQGDAAEAITARGPGEHSFTLPEGLPSPISGLGRGYRRMVKPDVLHSGGRVVFSRRSNDDGTTLHELVSKPRSPPGHRVAAPPVHQGDARGFRYVSGTSNAAALTSRLAAELVNVLEQLSDQPNSDELAKVPMALWLKTLIVHGASWSPRALSLLQRVLRTDRNTKTFTDEISAILGFGQVSQARVTSCAPERVTILAGGSIAAGERCAHLLPLPSSLNAHAAWRRFTVTMSWFTPINPNHQKYRRAFLWFEPPVNPNTLAVKRRGVDWRAVRRGTVQHEVLEGDRTAVNIGANATLELPVSCMADAGELNERIPYAIAVTLEVAPGVNTRIYDEVRARIAQRVAVRA